jgi:hypothetical protein
MKLSKMMAKKFEDKLEEYFEEEKVDRDFLSQENYDSCFDRAMDWIQMSFDGTKDAMATDAGYAIALDREKHANENTYDEQAELLKAGADPEIKTMSFWMD